MRLLSTADWHLRGKDIDAVRAQLYALEDVATENPVDAILIAGDIFDRSNISDSYKSAGALIGLAREVVTALSRIAPVYILRGNHDQSGAGAEDALHVFDHDRGVTVVREPMFLTFENGPTAFFIPWMWSSDRSCEEVISGLAAEANTGKFILAGHLQVAGAVLQGSQTCEAAPGKWQVSRAFLDRLGAERILLGDFHRRQELVMGRGGYIGALRQCNFGEEGNPAGVEIWNSETGKVEWFELNAAPRHRTVLVSAGTEMITPEPGEKLRVRFLQSSTPSAADMQAMDRAGVTVEQEVGRGERLQRAEVPEGIVHNPEAMIRLWAGAQTPPVCGSRLDNMLAAFLGNRKEQTL